MQLVSSFPAGVVGYWEGIGPSLTLFPSSLPGIHTTCLPHPFLPARCPQEEWMGGSSLPLGRKTVVGISWMKFDLKEERLN
ncbi:hypothetical protein E2C01_028557 [Portunus trituberculatus]|uniref:Uncharacterized protein n=1 Tax=Portunus trituberculatus TaxID=210409 RepID=A0A5B7EKR4_PORTR|nr:hypothetical protein [Portunus trituberculatus]